MVRTQIQLTEGQAARLKRLAARKHASVSELIRRGVDAVLQSEAVGPEEKKRRAIAAAGRFRSGVGDLSAKHDEYLSKAYRK
jgi:Arc/MetJ-type ribon-helix-helix transcriptional regulator